MKLSEMPRSVAPVSPKASPSGIRGKPDFKLLRFFLGGSLLAFLVVAVLLGYLFRTLSIDGLLHGYESEHVNQARIMANEMWHEGFGPLIVSVQGKSAAELQVVPQIPEVHQKVLMLLKGTSIFKIKVYDPKGMTIYSTELKQIGEDKSKNAGVVNGLRGLNSTELVHRDQFSAFEGEVQNRDLAQSYIPIRADQQIVGVFEIYGDATAVLAEIVERQWRAVSYVIGLLALLYLALSIIVKRAQDLIVRNSLEREGALRALALSEERWQFALEGSGEGVWDRNLQTGEVVFSKAYRKIYGYAENELVNCAEDWEARVHPDDLSRVAAVREAYFAGDQASYTNERRMQCRDGSWKWILSRGMVVARDELGNPLRMIGTHTDISERHEREESLRLAATVSLTMDEAVVVTNTDNMIISVNPAFTVITGYEASEVVGKNPRLLSSGAHTKSFYRQMWEQLGAVGSWHGEIRNRRKSGELYTEWLSIKQVRNEDGRTTHYVGVSSDISERKADQERLQQLAHFDVLTGLPNRTLFSDRLHQALARARRDSVRMALMFIDLDKFKPVNDTLGHHVGDLLLKEVANRLLACVRRESDTVGRIGGDEFVVMLSEIQVPQDAQTIAQSILHTLRQTFQVAGHMIEISSSIGIAIFPEHGEDESTLLKSADTAMYLAKDGGRNRVNVAQEPLV